MTRTEKPPTSPSVWSWGVLGVAALAAPGVAAAGGLVLPGNGPVSTGRAGASVASIDDATAIGINPARLAAVEGGTTIYIGTAMVGYKLAFTRAGSYEHVTADNHTPDAWEGQPFPKIEDASSPPIGVGSYQAVPVIAVSSRLGGKVEGLTVGAGIMAPTAYPTRSLGAGYTLEQPGVAPPPTRYDTVTQEAAIVLPTIAAAYQINDQLSVGARFSSGFGSIKAQTYVWGLPNFDEWVGRDGKFTVDVKDNFVPSFGVGAHYAVNDAIELGAAWNSGYTIDGKGTGTNQVGSGNNLGGMPVTIVAAPDPLCAKGGTDQLLKACVTVKLPWIGTVGGRYVKRDDAGNQVADVELDVDYEAWKDASDYEVIVDGFAAVAVSPSPVGLPLQRVLIRHNLQDTMSVRLGGSWQTPVGANTLILRGGVAYDTAAAKKGWERVDFDGAARTTATVGASLRLARMQIDAGGGFVYEGTRTQGTGCNPAGFGQGCTPGSTSDPQASRPGPDPAQPTSDSGGQQESPFNEGKLESSYTMFLLGVSTWF